MQHLFKSYTGASYAWSDVGSIHSLSSGVQAKLKSGAIVPLEKSLSKQEHAVKLQKWENDFEAYKAMEMQSLHAAIAREKAKSRECDEMHSEELLETLGSVGC